MNGFHWTCQCCGGERPDAAISVARHDVSEHRGLPAGTWTENVRYCNDRRPCIAAALAHPDPPAPFFPSGASS